VSSWNPVKVGSFLTPVKRPITIEDDQTYKQVTVMVKGRGAKLRCETPGSEIGTKKQNTTKTGDVIMSKIDARHGAVAVVPRELDGAVVTQDFPLFAVSGVSPEFAALLLTSAAFVDLAERASRGTTNRQRLNVDVFLSQQVLMPDLATQQVIVAAAERVRSACGELRSAALAWGDAVLALPAVHLQALVAASAVQTVPLSELLTRVKRPVTLQDGVTYRRMGLSSWGRGTWVRDEVDGSTVGTKKQFIIREGDFVYSVPGAWSGCFAVVGADQDGCVGTQNFPTFAVSERVLPEYLVTICSTPGTVLDAVKGQVRGVAQPNTQPARLLEVEVPLPDLATQASIAAAAQASIAAAAQASIAAAAYADSVAAMQQELVDDLVTGRSTPADVQAALLRLTNQNTAAEVSAS
jgi:type I restriction enzyme, S subunit